ncbi:MAG: hypothetical protein JJU06_14410 [Ectothiorhodospiraceae bacterium]|nr:hypothetical protein [Ectothiorhodospiraceae bacterium]
MKAPTVSNTSASRLDQEYLDAVLGPIRKCANYTPKFGQGGKDGMTLEQFQRHYQADQFYSWFGLDNPLMYAAHKAAGGMTSVYRQIGIGCEALFRKMLRNELGLSDKDARWSYEVPKANGGTRKLSLDGRIPFHAVKDEGRLETIKDWVYQQADFLGVDESVKENLKGVVFEVRQGYKSKDSKRQNADISNAATAYTKAYLPCVVVLSSQIDGDISSRYRGERWALLTGGSGDDPFESTYAFARDIVGYDLAGFFQRNEKVLRSEVDQVLRKLLSPETP